MYTYGEKKSLLESWHFFLVFWLRNLLRNLWRISSKQKFKCKWIRDWRYMQKYFRVEANRFKDSWISIRGEWEMEVPHCPEMSDFKINFLDTGQRWQVSFLRVKLTLFVGKGNSGVYTKFLWIMEGVSQNPERTSDVYWYVSSIVCASQAHTKDP